VRRPVVLDASAGLEMVLGRPEAERVVELLEEAPTVIAPDLFAAEVANGLWKYLRAGELDLDEAVEYLELCLGTVDRLLPAGELIVEALTVAASSGHPVYDLLYAVSARRNAASVCTLDRRLRDLLTAMEIPAVP